MTNYFPHFVKLFSVLVVQLFVFLTFPTITAVVQMSLIVGMAIPFTAIIFCFKCPKKLLKMLLSNDSFFHIFGSSNRVIRFWL